MNRYVVDPSWVRCDGVVFAGSPVTKFSLTARGREVAIAIEHGEPIEHDALIDRLLAKGAIHPLPTPHVHELQDVTVVIPARISSADELVALQQLIDALSSLPRIIVVDDHSPVRFTEIHNATLMRSPVQMGPGGARNVGLRQVDTSFVLFVDVDVDITIATVQRLLDHFTHDNIALVAPRVRSTLNDHLIARYETTQSPLDMGEIEANVRKGTRVSYVPSATWLGRTAALRKIGGFDETLRTGEDVDAVWRLTDAGFTTRYEPNVTVSHRSRPTLQRFIAQRIGYGESAAALAKRHGVALAPVRMNPVLLGAWVAALISPAIAAVVIIVDVARLTRALARTPDESKVFARLALRNLAHSATTLASAITRVWWPIVVLLALVSKRARMVLALATLIPTTLEWSKDPQLVDPLRFAALRILDDASYGIGVWRGAIRQREIRPLSIALSRASRYREGG